MKKALFATTALVATSGVAFADISISGHAEMGVTGGNGDTKTAFHSYAQFKFDGSIETDGGLTAGFTGRVNDSAGDVNGNASWGRESVFISGAFGTLTMGDTDGGYDWALGEVGTGSSIADNQTSHAGYNGNSGFDSGQVLRYDNSFGDFGFGVSVELDNEEAIGARDSIAFGVKYTAAMGGVDLSIGMGYAVGSSISDAMDAVPATYTSVAEQILGTPDAAITWNSDGDDGTTPDASTAPGGDDGIVGNGDDPVITAIDDNDTPDDPSDDVITYVRRDSLSPIMTDAGSDAVPAMGTDQDLFGISLSAAMANGFTVNLNYSDGYQGGMDQSHIGIGFGFTSGPVSVGANYGEYDETGEDGFGIAVSYDLGGGIAARAGYEDSSDNTSSWSLGLGMSF